MNDVFKEIKQFFDFENKKYHIDENYDDTLRFRSYGQSYTIRYDQIKSEYIFWNMAYQDIDLLIKAINKQCRGGDGEL